jgi:MID domain of medPIWI
MPNVAMIKHRSPFNSLIQHHNTSACSNIGDTNIVPGTFSVISRDRDSLPEPELVAPFLPKHVQQFLPSTVEYSLNPSPLAAASLIEQASLLANHPLQADYQTHQSTYGHSTGAILGAMPGAIASLSPSSPAFVVAPPPSNPNSGVPPMQRPLSPWFNDNTAEFNSVDLSTAANRLKRKRRYSFAQTSSLERAYKSRRRENDTQIAHHMDTVSPHTPHTPVTPITPGPGADIDIDSDTDEKAGVAPSQRRTSGGLDHIQAVLMPFLLMQAHDVALDFSAAEFGSTYATYPALHEPMLRSTAYCTRRVGLLRQLVPNTLKQMWAHLSESTPSPTKSCITPVQLVEANAEHKSQTASEIRMQRISEPAIRATFEQHPRGFPYSIIDMWSQVSIQPVIASKNAWFAVCFADQQDLLSSSDADAFEMAFQALSTVYDTCQLGKHRPAPLVPIAPVVRKASVPISSTATDQPTSSPSAASNLSNGGVFERCDAEVSKSNYGSRSWHFNGCVIPFAKQYFSAALSTIRRATAFDMDQDDMFVLYVVCDCKDGRVPQHVANQIIHHIGSGALPNVSALKCAQGFELSLWSNFVIQFVDSNWFIAAGESANSTSSPRSQLTQLAFSVFSKSTQRVITPAASSTENLHPTAASLLNASLGPNSPSKLGGGVISGTFEPWTQLCMPSERRQQSTHQGKALDATRQKRLVHLAYSMAFDQSYIIATATETSGVVCCWCIVPVLSTSSRDIGRALDMVWTRCVQATHTEIAKRMSDDESDSDSDSDDAQSTDANASLPCGVIVVRLDDSFGANDAVTGVPEHELTFWQETAMPRVQNLIVTSLNTTAAPMIELHKVQRVHDTHILAPAASPLSHSSATAAAAAASSSSSSAPSASSSSSSSRPPTSIGAGVRRSTAKPVSETANDEWSIMPALSECDAGVIIHSMRRVESVGMSPVLAYIHVHPSLITATHQNRIAQRHWSVSDGCRPKQPFEVCCHLLAQQSGPVPASSPLLYQLLQEAGVQLHDLCFLLAPQPFLASYERSGKAPLVHLPMHVALVRRVAAMLTSFT